MSKISIEREELRHLRGLVSSMEPEPGVDYEYWCEAMSTLNDMIGKAAYASALPEAVSSSATVTCLRGGG